MDSRTIVQRERGFTLVELMIVMLVLGILAAIALQFVPTALEKARVNADIAQGSRVKEAMDVFYVRNDRYPNSIDELMNSGFINSVVSAQLVNGQRVTVNTSNPSGSPVFSIDLANGSVVVYDVSSSPYVQVWSSGSN